MYPFKRALRAHTYSYVAIYEMALEEFFKDNPQLKDVCMKATEGVENACFERGKREVDGPVKQSNTILLEALATADVITVFQNLGDGEVEQCNVQGHDELPT